MCSVKTFGLLEFRRVGLAVITVALTLWAGAGGIAQAQQVGVDIAIGTGDQALTDASDITALPDETIVIEVFASDFAGQNGVEAVFEVSDPSAIVAASIATEGGTFFPQVLPALITGNVLRANWISIFAPTDDGDGLQFVGKLTFTLSSTFAELDLRVTEINVGTLPVQPNFVLRAANQSALPKTFAADLNRNPGNQGVIRGRANPGGPIGVQVFAGNLVDVTSYEIQVEVNVANIAPDQTTFVPAPPFVAQVPGSGGGGGGLPTASQSSFANGAFDIQNGTGDGSLDSSALTVTADGGSTVSLEIYGSNFEGAVGVEANIRMSDPSAVTSITSTTGAFTIKLSEPMVDGDLIAFNIGALIGVSAGTAPSLAGTLILELAPGFNGLSLSVESLVFSVSGVEGSPNAVLNIEPAGGIQDSGSGLGPTSPSSFANGEFDIQNGPGNNTLDPQALSVIAEGGSTVAVEIFGSNVEGAFGVQAQIRMSDPSAVRSISSATGSFTIKLSEPTATGDVIQFDIGSLLPVSVGSDPARAGTLLIELAPNYNGLTLSVESLSFPPSGVEGVPNAVLNIEPPGGVAPSLIAVDGNTITVRATSPVPVSGNIRLGNLAFLTRPDFRGAQITFTQVTFISDTPAAIQPNVTLTLLSNVSDAPIVSDPVVPLRVTNESAIIQWGTNRSGTGRVIFGTDPEALDQTATELTTGNRHRVEMTGLTSGTRYFYQVITADSQGRESDAFPNRPLFIVTRRTADTKPPSVVKGPAAVGVTIDGATIVFETDEASNAEVLFGTDAASLTETVSSVEESRIHELRLSGLTGGQPYFFKLRLTDALNNTFETPQARRFQLRSAVDTQSPRIVGRPSVAAKFSAAAIRWITTKQSSSNIFYGLRSGITGPVAKQASADLTDSLIVDELVNRHQLALSNLLADTTYAYQVRSIDASGNEVLSTMFTFRTTADEDTVAARIVRPPVVPRRSDTEALIVLRTNEPSTVTVQYDTTTSVLGDETGTAGESVSTTAPTRSHEVRLTNLVPARVYYYQIAVTDLAGNGPTYNVGELSFATRGGPDTAPPVVFSRPVALGITQEGATISWAADEPHSAVISLRVAGAAKQADGFDEVTDDIEVIRRHAVAIAGLQTGVTYEYQVATIDASGNESVTADLSFTTASTEDVSPPAIVRGPRVVNLTASTATIEWLTDEPADTRLSSGLSIDYDNFIETAEGVRFHSVTLTDLEPGTEYHYAVGSADASGNVVTTDANGTITGLSQDHTFTTRSTADGQPPVIVNGPLAEIRNNLVILRWRTDELSTSRVAVGVLPGSDDAAIEGAPVFGEASEIIFDENELVRPHSVTVTGLTPGLDYLFQVSSTDPAGNTVSGVNPTLSPKLQVPGGFGSFTTTTEEDSQFPVITGGPTVVASTSSSLTVEWDTDESANSTVDFGTNDVTDGQEVSGSNETTHRVVLTKLAAGTTYSYQVGSTDASGNGATKSAVVVGSTPASEDLTPPVITTDPAVIYVNDRQATISWVTSEAADGEISYGTSSGDLTEIVTEEDFNTTHTLTLTNLGAGTPYFFQVASIDQSNNGPATSAIIEFTTEALPDLTQPEVSDVSSVASDKEAVITWSTNEPSDSSVQFGLSGSLDFNSGSANDVTTHSVTLTNLTASTEYSFQVESIDQAGNGPASGTLLTFTTLAEGESPTVLPPAGLAATAGNNVVALTWTESTSGGITGNIVERSEEGGDFSPIATLENISTYIDNNVVNGTNYTYRVVALGLQQAPSDPSDATGTVTPAADGGPSIPTLFVKQGDPASPTFVVNNSSASDLNPGADLTYTFQISTTAEFTDAVTLDSGLSEGAGLGSTDSRAITAWTVDRTLDDGTTYHYRIKSSDGTFDSEFLTGSFTVDLEEPPFLGDVNGDFAVNFTDFVALVGSFLKSTGDADFLEAADFNNDGSVNFTDFVTMVGVFLLTYVQPDEVAAKPVVLASYGVNTATRIELVGQPVSSESGGEWVVDISVKNAQDLMGLGITLNYDPSSLTFVEASQGDNGLLLTDDREADAFGVLNHDAENGKVFIAGAVTTGDAITANEGVFASVRFVLTDDHPQGNLLDIVEGLIIDGSLGVSVADNIGARLSLLPEAFALDRNFPNPFNPETTIRYAVPEAADVRLIVYNILGQEIVTLADERHVPGFYALRWNGKDQFGRGVASGVYLYRIQATAATETFTQVHKMLLLK
jgi:phosphodiesterase/alkaline phosphatase D-like protein